MPLHPHFVMKILELSTRSSDLAGFIAPDGHVISSVHLPEVSESIIFTPKTHEKRSKSDGLGTKSPVLRPPPQAYPALRPHSAHVPARPGWRGAIADGGRVAGAQDRRCLSK